MITYGMDYSGAYGSPFTQRPGLEQPLIYWTPSIAPTGLAMYRGDKFPAWRGDRAAPDGYLYVCTDEADGRVLRLEPAHPLEVTVLHSRGTL